MRTKELILISIASLILFGCQKNGKDGLNAVGIPGPSGPTGPAAPTPTPPAVDTEQEDIDEMIAQKNADRAVLAQAPLTSGLSCTVVKVASGQCLTYHASYTNGCINNTNAIVATGTTYTYLYKGSFNQPNSGGADPILLLPTALRPMFQGSNFKIVCTGQIVVRESNYYDFSTNSDDGSLLYVNSALVINNDNNHGMTLRTGSALLYRGVQPFQVQYAQTGGGNYGLIVQAGGATIDPKYYFH